MCALVVLEGDDLVRVVGTSHYQDELLDLTGGRAGDEEIRVQKVALFVPEPDNPHDPNAIAIQIDGRVVGYISREENKRWLDVVTGHEVGAEAMIAGRRGTTGLGVFLRVPTPTEARAQIGIANR